MTSPIARLQSLSDEERGKLVSVLKRKLMVRALVFSSVILAGIAVVVFFNKYSGNYKVVENLEVINVVFVVVIVICARFMFSEFQEYSKEVTSQSKKVIRTKIVSRDGDMITLGNKSFDREDILLDNSDFDSLKGGDEVQLEISARSNIIFSVKKASKE